MFSAFFSGMEIAFISSSKLRIELANKQGELSGRIYSFFLKHPARFIGAMLVGNNIALVIYGILLAKLVEPYLIVWFSSNLMILITQTIIATLIVLITAEFIPKTLFRINPNRILTIFTLPALIVYYALYPLVWLVIGLSDFFLKYVVGTDVKNETPVFGKIDLDNYLNEGLSDDDQSPEETEVKIFRNALDFSNVKIRDCMVPRTEITALSIDESIEVLQRNFIKTGLSRIIIYEEDIEHVVGYAHSYEMFKKPENIKSIMLPISLIPESMSANDLLKSFIKEQRSIAIVLDEFGGTAGMVTMEDVMEELFGEIEDEH
ncbi:MAG: hemolysin, partial [Bacteroidetes bacterium]